MTLRFQPAYIRVINRRASSWAVIGSVVQNAKGGRAPRHRRLRLRSAGGLRSGSGGSQCYSAACYSAL